MGDDDARLLIGYDEIYRGDSLEDVAEFLDLKVGPMDEDADDEPEGWF